MYKPLPAGLTIKESKVQGFTEVFEAEGKEFTIEDYKL